MPDNDDGFSLFALVLGDLLDELLDTGSVLLGGVELDFLRDVLVQRGIGTTVPNRVDGDDPVALFGQVRDDLSPTIRKVRETMDEDDGVLVRVTLLAKEVVCRGCARLSRGYKKDTRLVDSRYLSPLTWAYRRSTPGRPGGFDIVTLIMVCSVMVSLLHVLYFVERGGTSVRRRNIYSRKLQRPTPLAR